MCIRGIIINYELIADVNECSELKNGKCSHKCANTVGGYKCECPDPELSLSADNKTCQGKCQIKLLLL